MGLHNAEHARSAGTSRNIEYTSVGSDCGVGAPSATTTDKPEKQNAKQQYDGFGHGKKSGTFTGARYAPPASCRVSSRSHCLSARCANPMSSRAANKNKPFLTVLFLAFGVGLAVGVALCAVWRYHPDAFSSQARVAAIAVCPPFLLVGILEATADSTVALIMTVGTIIFANGFLYAGLASFAYFLGTVFFPKRRA